MGDGVLGMSPSLAARLIAFGALFVVAAALVVVLTGDGADRATAADPRLKAALVAVETRSEAVIDALEELRPGRAAAPARDSVRAAMAEADRLLAAAGGDERVRNAAERHREYLDALGSVLSNPRSRIRGEVAERGERARAAYAAVPGGAGVAGVIGGWPRALEYARWRRGR